MSQMLRCHQRERLIADPRQRECQNVTKCEGSFLFLPPLTSRQHLLIPPGRLPIEAVSETSARPVPLQAGPRLTSEKPHVLHLKDARHGGSPTPEKILPPTRHLTTKLATSLFPNSKNIHMEEDLKVATCKLANHPKTHGHSLSPGLVSPASCLLRSGRRWLSLGLS